MEEENEGSMLLGLVLGFFLTCIGIVVALVLKGRKTLIGAVIGLVLNVALTVCASLGIVGLQMFLLSGS